jgi:hypothetical protein
MVDLQPTPFTTASPLLVNFDYTDISSGVGFEEYNFMQVENSAGDDYLLSPDTPYSSEEVRMYQASESFTPFSIRLDDDYDLTEFTINRTAKGTGIINIDTIQFGSGGNSAKHYFIVKVRKWDGVTETDIATAQSETRTYSGNYASQKLLSFPIVIPETQFVVGETLRVTIEFWARVEGHAATIGMDYGTDPANRTYTRTSPSSATLDTTKSNIKIPFLLNL